MHMHFPRLIFEHLPSFSIYCKTASARSKMTYFDIRAGFFRNCKNVLDSLLQMFSFISQMHREDLLASFRERCECFHLIERYVARARMFEIKRYAERSFVECLLHHAERRFEFGVGKIATSVAQNNSPYRCVSDKRTEIHSEFLFFQRVKKTSHRIPIFIRFHSLPMGGKIECGTRERCE